VPSAEVIDGKAVAAGVRERVRSEVECLVRDHGVTPGLATVLVGEDPASHVYVRRKREACAEVGIASFHHELGADTTQDQLSELLVQLNEQPDVHGILMQLPVPEQIDGGAMTSLIDPRKDVDGLHPVNAGLLMQGRPGMVPCTPAGVIELLRAAGTPLSGAEAVVVGRSDLVGRPVAALLLGEDATVTTCHSRTRDLREVCRRAEVLVVAVGRPRLVDGDMVRDGATVIDVGTNRTDDGLVGDVDFDSVVERARAVTPVPGGVGPMTIAMLLSNTLEAATRQAALHSGAPGAR
jgi:methylenetetrahydrofolate dehydrogenase (NADP+) / methenyltetrahydrofolate cyclohydrolase